MEFIVVSVDATFVEESLVAELSDEGPLHALMSEAIIIIGINFFIV